VHCTCSPLYIIHWRSHHSFVYWRWQYGLPTVLYNSTPWWWTNEARNMKKCCKLKHYSVCVSFSFFSSFFLSIYLSFFLSFATVPQWARSSSFTRFLDHTQRRTTVGRTPLDGRLARCRDLYLTTHNNHNRQTSMPPRWDSNSGERPQTYALERAATGSGSSYIWLV